MRYLQLARDSRVVALGIVVLDAEHGHRRGLAGDGEVQHVVVGLLARRRILPQHDAGLPVERGHQVARSHEDLHARVGGELLGLVLREAHHVGRAAPGEGEHQDDGDRHDHEAAEPAHDLPAPARAALARQLARLLAHPLALGLLVLAPGPGSALTLLPAGGGPAVPPPHHAAAAACAPAAPRGPSAGRRGRGPRAPPGARPWRRSGPRAASRGSE